MVGVRSITSRLLDLPDGPYFKRIAVPLLVPEDILLTMDLVSRCPDTLESLRISNHLEETVSLDLSTARKLKGVTFVCKTLDIHWIATALDTMEIKNIQGIAFVLSHDTIVRSLAEQSIHREWLDIDHLLAQFWASYSLRPRLSSECEQGDRSLEGDVAKLLPESTKRGIVDLRRSNGPLDPTT